MNIAEAETGHTLPPYVTDTSLPPITHHNTLLPLYGLLLIHARRPHLEYHVRIPTLLQLESQLVVPHKGRSRVFSIAAFAPPQQRQNLLLLERFVLIPHADGDNVQATVVVLFFHHLEYSHEGVHAAQVQLRQAAGRERGEAWE